MLMSEVADLLAAMVRLPSVNPSGCAPEGPNEGEERMTRFVHDWLADRGIECHLQRVEPGRENVIARVPGRAEPPIVFESHMDTVSVDGMTIPAFDPRIEDGRMYGRGSCDTKSSLAGMMVALRRVAEGDPPPRTIVLAAVVDEEYLHGGVARFLQDSGPVASAVIGEPTELRVVVAHKGALRTRVITRGVSAHSSNPDNGENAIYRMARVVQVFEQFAESLREHEPHPLVGRPTLSVGTIEGGNAVNVVPDLCQIMVDRRLIPGETPDEAFEVIGNLLAPHLGPDDEFMHTLKDPPVETDADSEVVRLAREAVRAIGGEDVPVGVAYCTDGCDFAERGIPLVVFGPGDIAQAHTADEWVELAQVEAAADVYE
ncbi:MAG: ArgE/DapE family deacylase, partial [Armatimonadia bacterium]|nr:ArgE/DapE family deacylase [Armatimonadia bacterium]